MRAVVFVNGTIADYSRFRAWLRADDYWVAADGGARHCLALGRRPNALVGDLDSVAPAVVTELAQAGVIIERHAITKDQTDLELALEFALRQGATEILLMGAIGDRLDQTLANLLILAQREWPAQLMLVEGNQLAQLVRPGQHLTLQAAPGDTVSILPLSDTVTGITYTGMRYPLTNATLALGSTRGVSNEVATTPATVTIVSGRLLLIQTLVTIP
ncbi:MAG: thiamine diphosphokinase [Caldilineaceae bacterium]|nr:thiamine diphosphokinase [Caldilineaceae bacterium]